MIAFLLGLLKVIGVLLLVILILLLVIAGTVLFVPICYSGKGQITAETKEISVKVTWLLKAVQCCVDYTFPETPIVCVKVFGIDVLRLLEKRKNKAAKTSEIKKKKRAAKYRKETSAPGVNTSLLEATEETTVAEITMEQAQKNKENAASEDTTKQDVQKIPLKQKMHSIIDKVKDIIYNIKYYIGILQEEDTKQLIVEAWQAILKILKSIRPKVFNLNAEFGLATPDTTGQVYGMYAVVMPIIGEHIVLQPNFEEQVFRGEAKLKGRITIFVIVVNILRIGFDKRLQPLISKLKRGGNGNGRK